MPYILDSYNNYIKNDENQFKLNAKKYYKKVERQKNKKANQNLNLLLYGKKRKPIQFSSLEAKQRYIDFIKNNSKIEKPEKTISQHIKFKREYEGQFHICTKSPSVFYTNLKYIDEDIFNLLHTSKYKNDLLTAMLINYYSLDSTTIIRHNKLKEIRQCLWETFLFTLGSISFQSKYKRYNYNEETDKILEVGFQITFEKQLKLFYEENNIHIDVRRLIKSILMLPIFIKMRKGTKYSSSQYITIRSLYNNYLYNIIDSINYIYERIKNFINKKYSIKNNIRYSIFISNLLYILKFTNMKIPDTC